MSVGLPSFAERAAAAFSALSPDEQPKSNLWTVSTRSKGPDIVSDAAAGNSSEDEQEEGSPTAGGPLLSWREVTGDCDADAQEEPSYAYRKAFEVEDEADEFDILAAETLTRDGGNADPKPHRSMEVLPDNAMDRICDTMRARQESVADAAEAHKHVASISARGGIPTSIQGHCRGRMASGSRSAAKEPVPCRKRHPRSNVPDHEQHPEKYACYTLEEPLSLCCPTKDAITEQEPSNSQVIMGPVGNLHCDRFIPKFGTGIAFRGRGDRKAFGRQSQKNSKEKTGEMPLVVSQADDDAEVEEAGKGQVDAHGGMLGKSASKTQHAKGRHYRRRGGPK